MIHKDADAFVMVIMSHGDRYGNLQSSDGQNLSIKDDIVTAFDGDNWPIMLGNPKVFLIQACRGSEFPKLSIGNFYHNNNGRFCMNKMKEIHYWTRTKER